MNLLERIAGWGQDSPAHLVHVSGERTLTYGELTRRSDALAAHLVRALPDDGSPVVVLGHKEPEMLIAFLGVVKAGHPYVPVDTALPRKRVARIVEIAGAPLVLTGEYLANFPDRGDVWPGRHIEPWDPFYVIFTSGSTGEPKGVVITLGCLTSFLDWMVAEQSPAAGDEVFLNQAPFSFDLSVMDMYLCLVTGGTLFSISAEDIANPKQLFHKLECSGVSTWVSTPSFARLCLAERRFSVAMLPRLRRFLFCGETLAPEVALGLLDRFPDAQVWNTYGPTEAAVATTSVLIDREMVHRYPSLPVGFPKPDARVLVVDEAGRPVEAGEKGEIVIVGPNVSPGYLGRPDLTARAFFQLDGQQAYRTGDWGRYKDGLLFFEGRMDSQIKLHGYRIEIGDVESNLRALAGVRDAVVIPTGKNGSLESLTACIILAQKPSGTGEFELSRIIRARLGERLPTYMLPRKFLFLDSFPMTANGKVDRRKLAEALD